MQAYDHLIHAGSRMLTPRASLSCMMTAHEFVLPSIFAALPLGETLVEGDVEGG